MAATVRATGTATSGTTTTSVTINRPSGTANGDVLYAVVVNGGVDATPTPSAPSGWTLVTSDGTTGGTDIWGGVYRKVVTDIGSEPTTYTWSNFTDSCTGCMVAVQGADTTTPERDTAANVNTGTTQTCPGVDANADDLILAFAAVDDNAGTTSGWGCATDPSTLTEQIEQASSGGADTLAAIAAGTKTTTGNTGTVDVTVTGDDDTVLMVVAVASFTQAPQNVDVGQATEADSTPAGGNTVDRLKSRTLGIAGARKLTP